MIERWRQSVGSRPGSGESASVAAAAALMRRVTRREGADGHALQAHLTEFGRLCGLGGVELADAAYLVEAVLPRVDRRLRSQLDRRTSGLRVAAGWMAGREQRESSNGGTGANALETLRLRIEQEQQRCAKVGMDLGQMCLLAVFEVDPFSSERNAPSAHHVAAALADHFVAGESMAVCPNGRVLALAGIDVIDAVRVRSLARTAERELQLAPGSIRAWLEPLQFDLRHLASHLEGLAA